MNEDKNIEGTFQLDGMLEGQLPPREDAEEKLREWVRTAEDIGLSFDLQIDGGSFNMLAEDDPVHIRDLPGKNPVEQVRNLLQQLLELLPDNGPSTLHSTLRGIEYRDGHSVQTVFRIRPDNTVDTIERTVDEETVSPDEFTYSKARLYQATAAGLLVLGITLFVFSFFFDYGDLLARGLRNITPLSADEIEVKNDTFRSYFSVKPKEIDVNRVLTLQLTRRAPFPSSPSDSEGASPPDTENNFIQQRLRTGYVRVELFDRNDQFIAHRMIRIKPLRRQQEMTIHLALPEEPRTQKITFTY